MGIDLIRQTSCCSTNTYLQFPFGIVLPARELSAKEIDNKRVSVSCFTKSRRFHVIVQATNQTGKTCFASVNADELAKYFQPCRGIPDFDEHYTEDVTDILQKKLKMKMDSTLCRAGFRRIPAGIVSNLVLLSKDFSCYEGRIADSLQRVWDKGETSFSQRFGSIRHIMVQKYKRYPEFASFLDKKAAEVGRRLQKVVPLPEGTAEKSC